MPGRAAAQVQFTEVGPALLPDGTSYGIRVPANWNGVVINDLDYVGARGGARSLYWLQQGYAISGIQRHPLRRFQYDPVREVDNLMTVLDIFESRFGKPRRVIHFGTSAGGQLALAIAELNPKHPADGKPRVDGVVAGCATTPIWTSGIRFDTHAVLKALLDPQNAALQFLGLPDNSSAYTQAWQQVFTAAAQTPQGRARLALGIAITQWNTWGVGLPRPDLTDLAAFENHLRALAPRIPDPAVNTQFNFETQVGVWIGNDGADYEAYWHNADPALKKVVRQLYDRAGLDLHADIRQVQASPRSPTNWQGTAFWLANSARTQMGTPVMPVFRYHTIGDPQALTAQVQAYTDEIRKNHKQDLYRLAFVEREGHCSFTVAESAAAMEIMMRRLNSDEAARANQKGNRNGDKNKDENLHPGEWDDTRPAALNALAASLNTGTQSSFIDYRLREFNGVWRAEPPQAKGH
jgi:pimeloyl-ACP methyl ester carboxylesterase